MKKLTLTVLLLLLALSAFPKEGMDYNGYDYMGWTIDRQEFIIFGWLLAANSMAEYYGDLVNISYFMIPFKAISQIRKDITRYYSYKENLKVPLYIAIVNSQEQT